MCFVRCCRRPETETENDAANFLTAEDRATAYGTGTAGDPIGRHSTHDVVVPLALRGLLRRLTQHVEHERLLVRVMRPAAAIATKEMMPPCLIYPQAISLGWGCHRSARSSAAG